MNEYQKEVANIVLSDVKFITGNISYKLDIDRLDSMMSAVTHCLSSWCKKERRNIGWHYYKNSCIINYTNDLRINKYNKTLYLIDVLTYIVNDKEVQHA